MDVTDEDEVPRSVRLQEDPREGRMRNRTEAESGSSGPRTRIPRVVRRVLLVGGNCLEYTVVEIFLADAWKSAGPRGSWTRERMGKTGMSEMEDINEVEEID